MSLSRLWCIYSFLFSLTLAQSFYVSSHRKSVRISIVWSLGSGAIYHWFVGLGESICSWISLCSHALEFHADISLSLSSISFLSCLIRWQIPKVLNICQHVIILSVYHWCWFDIFLFWTFFGSWCFPRICSAYTIRWSLFCGFWSLWNMS